MQGQNRLKFIDTSDEKYHSIGFSYEVGLLKWRFDINKALFMTIDEYDMLSRGEIEKKRLFGFDDSDDGVVIRLQNINSVLNVDFLTYRSSASSTITLPFSECKTAFEHALSWRREVVVETIISKNTIKALIFEAMTDREYTLSNEFYGTIKMIYEKSSLVGPLEQVRRWYHLAFDVVDAEFLKDLVDNKITHVIINKNLVFQRRETEFGILKNPIIDGDKIHGGRLYSMDITLALPALEAIIAASLF